MDIRPVPASDTWPLRHSVMWPEKDLDFVKLPGDEGGLHFGLHIDDRLTSVVSLFVHDDSAQFRKFATRREDQGRGYGTTLLRHVFAELERRGVTRVWCNARLDKTGFYRRFDMTETAERFVREGLEYVIMERRFAP